AGGRGGTVSSLRLRRHRSRSVPGVDDYRRHLSGPARHLLHDRRDGGDAGGALPRLRAALALHAAARVPRRVAGGARRSGSAVYDITHWWGRTFEFAGTTFSNEKRGAYLEYAELPSRTSARP